jgi:hypothetical protein
MKRDSNPMLKTHCFIVNTGSSDGHAQDTALKEPNGSPNLQASGNNVQAGLNRYWDTSTGRGMQSLEAYTCLEDYVTDTAQAHSNTEIPLFIMLVSDPNDMRKPFVVAGGVASKPLRSGMLVRRHELAL